MSNFASTNNRGFQMTFENGWTISVQFGYGNYCSNRNHPDGLHASKDVWYFSCPDAEIAIWDSSGKSYDFGHDTAKGYWSADEVAEWISRVSHPEFGSTNIRNKNGYMKLKINNKIFNGRYNEKDQLIVMLDDDFDKLFFKKWQNRIIDENGTLTYNKKDYVEDIDFIKVTERGTLKNCFPMLSRNEDFVIIHYDLYETVS